MSTNTSEKKTVIIMAAYNAENTIVESINSILWQTHPLFKFIIVNDGSTDSTPEILDRIARTDNRIVVLHQKNSGAGGARNSGIEHALKEKSDYVGFIDSDDIWHPQKLEAQLKVFRAHEDVDCVITDMQNYDKAFEVAVLMESSITDNIIGYDNIVHDLCFRNFTYQPVTTLIKSEWCTRLFRYGIEKAGEDFYPHLNVAINGAKFYRINIPLYRERSLQTSLQRSPGAAYFGAKARVTAISRLLQEGVDEHYVLWLKQGRDRYLSWQLAAAREIFTFREAMPLFGETYLLYRNKYKWLIELVKFTIYQLYRPKKTKLY